MVRFGLCCIFLEQPIKFRRTTAKFLSSLSKDKRYQRLAEICASNAENLMKALVFCKENGIGSFRINSQILPLVTHPEMRYEVLKLPGGKEIVNQFKACGRYTRKNDVRTTFHPDQFIVLSSPRNDVVERSIADLEYQAMVAEWVNADVINIHGGGAYNDKKSSLKRLARTIKSLSRDVQSRLTLENDDRSYTPEDLLPVCEKLQIPMVYDVHHHRCLKDRLSVPEATQKALETWNREPLFHISSPLDGWVSKNPRKHADRIDISDFPEDWLSLDITVEVEAKEKEIAILKLKDDLSLSVR